ncbi:MAG: S8 family serine peptidase [Acidobacteriota bacterium]
MPTRKSSKRTSHKDDKAGVPNTANSETENAAATNNAAAASPADAAPPAGGFGDYIEMNGQHLRLVEHPTDFSVLGRSTVLDPDNGSPLAARVTPLTAHVMRAQATDSAARDQLMDEVRTETVAHHIYQVEGTDEEIVIDNRIFLTLRNEDPRELEDIVEQYKLVPEGRMGDAYVLRVTEATGMNPLKAANRIAQREGVVSCSPQVLVPMQMHQGSLAETHRLFRRQWYLTADLISSPDLDPTASIRAPEAWRITTGSPEIVIAVIDDGFDLTHPAFRNKRIHPDQRDFAVAPQDQSPLAEGADFHGTCVASIATGSLAGDGMVGVAPDCTFLPIRIGFGSMAAPLDILDVFRYVSRRADVVNCSFGTSPTSFDPFPAAFRNAITELTLNGGRRGKGLVMVFSAANDDAPTLMSAAQNRNGVFFVRFTPTGGQIASIPQNMPIFSGYPLTRGVVVVGAMSSLKRKAGYSSWGPQLTVTAPSNNMHYITRFVRQGVNDAVRNRFVAPYRGLGQIAAVNRPFKGSPFEPLPDDPSTLDFAEHFYTASFGGTSGAAPVVTGVVALMLSVNPHLTAEQVKQILMATADRDLDPRLDLANDPNVQGLNGAFVSGRSLFFGSGKVNALRAVERARALLGPITPSAPLALSSAVGTGLADAGNYAQGNGYRAGGLSITLAEPGATVVASSLAGRPATSPGPLPLFVSVPEPHSGTVHYEPDLAQIVEGAARRVLIEHRSDMQYDFSKHAPAARNHLKQDLHKSENDPLAVLGIPGSIGTTDCLFYTLIG